MHFFRSASRSHALAVSCPSCTHGALVVLRSCQTTRLSCSRCNRQFAVAELATTLDEEAFAQIAAALGDRLADRV